MTFIDRRSHGGIAVGGAAFLAPPELMPQADALGFAVSKKRLTDAEMYTASNWNVVSTDLEIPYVLDNESIGYLFGDTLSAARPEGGRHHRFPVMLRSASDPGAATASSSIAP